MTLEHHWKTQSGDLLRARRSFGCIAIATVAVLVGACVPLRRCAFGAAVIAVSHVFPDGHKGYGDR